MARARLVAISTTTNLRKTKQVIKQKYIKNEGLDMNPPWLNEVLPNGLSHPSSTVISGEGGSGKPLIALGLIQNWLESNNNVIFIPLQYPKPKFTEKSMKKLYGKANYPNRTSHIQFDPDIDEWIKENGRIKANLLKPSVWEEVIKEAEKSFDNKGKNMVFSSALNLLLFSPTYKESIITKLEEMIKGEKERSYLFAVSTSAFREDIKKWEEAADNLMFARMGENMTLYLKTKRIGNKEVKIEEKKIPIEKEMLKEIKKTAEKTRKKKIPKLSKI